MRIRNSKPTPNAEFFRQQRLRADRMVKPHLTTHNGARFLIAPNGIRIPLQYAETVKAYGATKGLFEMVSLALRPKAVKLS